MGDNSGNQRSQMAGGLKSDLARWGVPQASFLATFRCSSCQILQKHNPPPPPQKKKNKKKLVRSGLSIPHAVRLKKANVTLTLLKHTNKP